MKKRALVLAGGIPQIELLQQLRDRNVETILIDGSPNAIAKEYADKFYNLDIFNIEAVKSIALKESVDFLITVCADQVLLVVSYVSEILGLPWYIDYNTARIVSDKGLMKKVFVDNSIPTTKYVVLNDYEPNCLSSLCFPLIVKPADAYSSKGVKKVNSSKELESAFIVAKGISRSKSVIVEEFFMGIELSIDVFVEDGVAHVLLVSQSDKIKDDSHFAIFRGRFQANLISEKLRKEIKQLSQRIASSFGIVNSPMLVQILTDGKDIKVLEICARTGGAMKWLLIKHASGVDTIKAVIDLSLGIKPKLNIKKPENNYIVNDYIYCYAGQFSRLNGFEEQLKVGNITDFRCLRPCGYSFSGHITSSTDRICGVTIQANTLNEINEKQKAFKNQVKVLDQNGIDIMRHDLFPDLVEDSFFS